MTRVVSRLDDQSCNESLLSLQRLVVEQDMLFRAYIISGQCDIVSTLLASCIMSGSILWVLPRLTIPPFSMCECAYALCAAAKIGKWQWQSCPHLMSADKLNLQPVHDIWCCCYWRINKDHYWPHAYSGTVWQLYQELSPLRWYVKLTSRAGYTVHDPRWRRPNCDTTSGHCITKGRTSM